MRIVAVDPSLTGLATFDGSVPRKMSTSPAMRMTERMRKLAQFVKNECATADLVLIEEPISHGPGPLTQLAGLAYVIRCRLDELDCPWIDIGNSQRAKWATGKGNGRKADVLLAAQKQLGYDSNDDNVSDAMWIWEIGSAAYAYAGVTAPTGARLLPQYRADVLATINWPEINGYRPPWYSPKPPKLKARRPT